MTLSSVLISFGVELRRGHLRCGIDHRVVQIALTEQIKHRLNVKRPTWLGGREGQEGQQVTLLDSFLSNMPIR